MRSSNHEFIYVPVYEDDWEKNPKPELWDNVGNQTWGVVFVDHRPGERRTVDIKRFSNKSDIIVVHDTEYIGYGYESVFSDFKYRFDYKRYNTYTTLVSNSVDVSKFF
jgi:predicted SPOUT superfamily RNA methylase MTH1